jgi:hypothetical protein
MVDRDRVEESLDSVWRATGRRIAVAAGAGTALVSLAVHVPVHVAALRGGLALCGVLAVARATAAALKKAAASDRERSRRREGAEA